MNGCTNLHQRSIQKNIWSPKRPNGCLGKTVRTQQTCFPSTLTTSGSRTSWARCGTQTPVNSVQLPPEPLQPWDTHGMPWYTAPELSTIWGTIPTYLAPSLANLIPLNFCTELIVYCLLSGLFIISTFLVLFLPSFLQVQTP